MLHDLTQGQRLLYARIVLEEAFGYLLLDGETRDAQALHDAGLIVTGTTGRLYPATGRHGLTAHIDRQDGTSRRPTNPAPTGEPTP